MVAAVLPRRGEIWLISLVPTMGSEVQKTRPCLVVSPPEMHDHLRTVIVAPMTSKGHDAPFRPRILFQDVHGLILLDQLRSVDKLRLIKRLGAASDDELSATLAVLRQAFAW